MSFDWSGYLTLAEYMINNHNGYPSEEPTREALYRSIVSRAYYAVYCLTRNYVRDVDHQEFFGNVHQELQNYLLRHSQPTRRKLGNQLRALHQNRIKADYHDNLDELPINKAVRAIAQAGKIAQGLASLPPGRTR
jgi:hypothetical protein